MAVRRFWLIAISNSEDELVAFPLGAVIRQATALYKIDQQKMKHCWILIADIYISTSMETFEHRKYKTRWKWQQLKLDTCF